MRILTFNILFGAYSPAGRLEAIARLLKKAKPTVVLLQECMDWNEERLEELAKLTAMRHFHLGRSNPRGSGKRYHLGVMSRLPLENVKSHGQSVLAHSCLEVSVGDVTLLNLHLNAGSEDVRSREIEHLIQAAFPPERVRSERLILGGDLNALSRHDPYPDGLGDVLEDVGVTKYGNPISHQVMDSLEETGWKDPLQGEDNWATRYRSESAPPIPTRTDYLLVSPPLEPNVENCEVLPLPNQESDHHPVMLELRF